MKYVLDGYKGPSENQHEALRGPPIIPISTLFCPIFVKQKSDGRIFAPTEKRPLFSRPDSDTHNCMNGLDLALKKIKLEYNNTNPEASRLSLFVQTVFKMVHKKKCYMRKRKIEF